MPLVDRIGLGLFAAIALLMFFLGGTGPNPQFMSSDWWESYFHIMFVVGMKLVLPIWLALRLFDLMAGGPTRRRGRVTVHHLD